PGRSATRGARRVRRGAPRACAGPTPAATRALPPRRESDRPPAPRPSRASSVDVVVRRNRQELRELLPERDALEQLAGLREAAAVTEPRRLVRDDALDLGALEAAVAHPLPNLRTRDLGRRRVLHQVVERRRADAAQPG